MKTALIIVGLFAVTCGPLLYDATGNRACRVEYGRSFDGLWLIKERACYGRFIGMENSRTEIARKPLFEAF